MKVSCGVFVPTNRTVPDFCLSLFTSRVGLCACRFVANGMCRIRVHATVAVLNDDGGKHTRQMALHGHERSVTREANLTPAGVMGRTKTFGVVAQTADALFGWIFVVSTNQDVQFSYSVNMRGFVYGLSSSLKWFFPVQDI